MMIRTSAARIRIAGFFTVATLSPATGGQFSATPPTT
jgi:hypothetical protein